MEIKKGLGRGLDALFQPAARSVVEKSKEDSKEVQVIQISDILINENQPRKTFDQEKLNELSKSIEKYGIIQPLVVTQSNNNKYELIAGERRLRAARSIGLTTVPVIVKKYDEQSKNEISLIENVQRENLNTLEQAQAYQYIMDKYDLTQENLAKNIGKSRSAVANSLRILKLSNPIKEYIKNEQLSEGHCKVLVSVDDPTLQEALATKAVINGLSVRQLEACLKKINEEGKEEKVSVVKKVANVWLNDIEERFKDFFQTKVQIKPNSSNSKGKIILDYYSNEELDRILEKINRG